MKKLKLSFEELQNTLEVIPHEALSGLKGGLSVIDFLDALEEGTLATGSYSFSNGAFTGSSDFTLRDMVNDAFGTPFWDMIEDPNSVFWQMMNNMGYGGYGAWASDISSYVNDMNYGGYTDNSGSGGSNTSNDCVLRCFDYLDGSSNTYQTYYDYASANLGFTSTSTGVPTSAISQIGAAGYLNVYDINTPSGVLMTTSGLTLSGERIMMTFPGDNGADHAVAVTGFQNRNGVGYIEYYDPTTNRAGERVQGDFSGLYAVGPTMAN